MLPKPTRAVVTGAGSGLGRAFCLELGRRGAHVIASDVDLEAAVAWKNGLIVMSGVDIKTVLRQISRWYDVDVEFKGQKLHDHLHAEFPLNTNLSDALNALESTGSAKFEIEGKKIIVTQ